MLVAGQPGRPGEKGVPGLPGSAGERGADGRPGKCSQENCVNVPYCVRPPLNKTFPSAGA